MAKAAYQNWQVTVDNQQYLWASLNKKDANVNSMNESVLDELEKIVQSAETYKGLVIQSGKSNGFIAGADIQSFTEWNGPEDAMCFIQRGQAVYRC